MLAIYSTNKAAHSFFLDFLWCGLLDVKVAGGRMKALTKLIRCNYRTSVDRGGW